ncbi:MAG: methionine synthase, partial [Propionibacteriaceae bacterium]|nr:methionine synthase [Propionibacteriaceae bacterium]
MSVPLRSVFSTRVLIADGGMGTMLQGFDLSLEDFQMLEGCNEILNLTRPEVVEQIHRAYLDAGADLISANTFGANYSAFAEYGIVDRIEELAEAGARLARKTVDEFSSPQQPRWVLGSMGPGTKLPSLSQATYAQLRDGYASQVRGMIRGGIDAVQIETSQDLLAVRAAVAGAKRAIAEAGVDCPVYVSVTMETTGTMLVGSDLSAVLATLIPLGVDALGLNCATGPEDMREHLRHLNAASPLPITCMPNAGLPVLSQTGAYYPLGAQDFAEIMDSFIDIYGLAMVGGCCGTTPDHIRALRSRVPLTQTCPERRPTSTEAVGAVSSLYSATPLTQDVSYLAIGERANASGSRAFRDAMLAPDWDRCVEIGRAQANQGAHVLDLCVDYVGSDGGANITQLVSRFSQEIDLPIQIDSSDPEVIRAGLERAPGRAIVNSVNFESGSGPESKFAATMSYAREHGAAVVALCIDENGQARTVDEKVTVARRLISVLTSEYGMNLQDIILDLLTFPITTGAHDTRRDAVHTITALKTIHQEYPLVHTVLGVSNVSYGLKPAARVVLNSVFLHECRQAGLDCAIVDPAKILPIAQIPDEQVQAALDLIWDRKCGEESALEAYLRLFDSVADTGDDSAEVMDLPTRLRNHILHGSAVGLGSDLDDALEHKDALAIINEDLLEAMKEVGERFGSGAMQLPFVLKSAEVMKMAMSHLEPHLDREGGSAKGTLVLATVRGDVHDIGKNLVDIIVSNNGYRVVNLGIKQPIADIISAAEQVGADAIGMSGLLVKSTVIMKENLEELNHRGLSTRYPVLLGGAALTRAYVEKDLAAVYEGEVRYARDAFEGLALMDAVMAHKAGVGELPTVRTYRQVPEKAESPVGVRAELTRPVPGGVDVPDLPKLGVSETTASIDMVLPWLDKRALFAGQWGLRAVTDGPSYEEVVASEGEPRLEKWIDYVIEENLLDFAVKWGYFPCESSGNELILPGYGSFDFPRQSDGE